MYHVRSVAIGEARQPNAKIYIPRIELGTSFFSAKGGGLLYHSDPKKTWQRKILPELTRVRRHNEYNSTNPAKQIDAVIFPELSIPANCTEQLVEWSRESQLIIIGGSHYEEVAGKWCSACPVVVGGQLNKTYKIVPSPFEDSGVDDSGLQSGPEVLKFRNTRLGNFSVFICSDYLDESVHSALVDDETDIVFVIACQTGVERHYPSAADRVSGVFGAMKSEAAGTFWFTF